jgi:hypothetical protein
MTPSIKTKRPKLQLGKMTPRKLFMGVGVVSWILGVIGCTTLGVGFLMGLGFIVITLFHGTVILAVFRRKPLHRKIVESNVVLRPVRKI